jgi:5-methylcytosine-specific restriction endonuclease McrA
MSILFQPGARFSRMNRFFCDHPFTEDRPATLEHLLSIAHGGNNHLSNLALAHGECNLRAANLSVVEKAKLRDELRTAA